MFKKVFAESSGGSRSKGSSNQSRDDNRAYTEWSARAGARQTGVTVTRARNLSVANARARVATPAKRNSYLKKVSNGTV